MAIRNVDLGGATDWGNETLTAADLNDTFDAAVTKIQSLSAFWLNSDLYDVYEDWNSETTGAFSTNTKWTVDTSGGGAVTVSETTNAGGATKEILINAGVSKNTTKSCSLTSRTLAANKHTFARIYVSTDLDRTGSGFARLTIGGTNYNFGTFSCSGTTAALNATSTIYTNLLIIALGSNHYDIYIGGKKLGSDVTVADIEFTLTASATISDTGSSFVNIYMDDVRQSKATITA